MKALIDGDIIAYKCGFAGQKTYHTVCDPDGEELFTTTKKRELKEWLDEKIDFIGPHSVDSEQIVEPVENVLHSVNLMIESILDRVKASSFVCYLSGDTNYREQVAVTKPYKGNRTQDKPIHLEAIREHMIKRWNAVVTDGIEADDAISIDQWRALHKRNTCVCSIDKDLDQVAGWHYNFDKDKKYWVDQELAYIKFYEQLLTGDSVDNIPGVPKVGPVKAKEIIDRCESYEQFECEVYRNYHQYYADPYNVMREMGKLVRIQRKEGEDWEPELSKEVLEQYVESA